MLVTAVVLVTSLVIPNVPLSERPSREVPLAPLPVLGMNDTAC